MIKQIALVHRKPGMSQEEFNRYWKDVHSHVYAKYSPGVRKYVQNHLIQIPGVKYEYDGIVETWFDDLDAQRKCMEFNRSPEGKELEKDAFKFLDMNGKITSFLVEEHIVWYDEASKNKAMKNK